jgi:hypothetical protein
MAHDAQAALPPLKQVVADFASDTGELEASLSTRSSPSSNG